MCNSINTIETKNIYILKCKLDLCPFCGTKLIVGHHTNLKEIITLNGRIKAKQITQKCPNEDCYAENPSKRRIFSSADYQMLALPKCTIGLDITIFIGYHMQIRHQSQDEVHKMLLPYYSGLNRATVYKQYELYKNYLQELTEIQKAEIKEEIALNKGYILSIDAVYVDGSPALLLARDILTRKVLSSKLIESENEKEITPFLEAVKSEYGVPVALLSDMGNGIHKSIMCVFPDVQHQYCHYHFLKNLGNALLEPDYNKLRDLTKENKKKTKNLASESRNIIDSYLENSDDPEIEQNVLALESLKQSLSIFNAKITSKKEFPFELPQIYWLTKAYYTKSIVEKALESLLNKETFFTLFDAILLLKNKLDDLFSPDVVLLIRRIKTLNTKFDRVRQILAEHTKSAKQIKSQLNLFFKQLKKHSQQYPRMKIIKKRFKKYWNNLFHAYDDSRIPFTNLEIEREFNILKRTIRKRTGTKIRTTFLIAEGEHILISKNILPDGNLLYIEKEFINYFVAKRCLVSSGSLSKRKKSDVERRKLLKKKFKKKYRLEEALKELKLFKGQISFR